ncbi:hypothetical protein FS749_006009 [Ceratobasidium sp. UAMH 11750]|nr:hypothetical protein FS749_006009 [Ceratobasidium sp. UAMH 11750]
MNSLHAPRFYQILGHKGHFKKEYWRWLPGANEPTHFHEFAHEEPAAQAIAGGNSLLYVEAPIDAAGTATAQAVELILGIRPWGAMSLLLDMATFDNYVKPQAGISGPTNKLPPLYPTSNYLSLSPIKFTSAEELEDMFKALRTKKPAAQGRDDSKLNNLFSEASPSRGRAEFEQARLLWYAWYGGRHNVLTTYGLPPISPQLRIAYLAYTPWIDYNSYKISPREDGEILDIGWYEPGLGNTHHIIIEEYESMSKRSLPKSAFDHGESTTLTESSLPGTLSSLISPSPETSTRPLVLVTYDWPRTARLLNTHGIDTNGPNWHVGLGKLLGFERPNQTNNVRDGDRGPRGNGPGAERTRDNGYQGRNGYENRRSGTRSTYLNVDDPNFYDSKPKHEIKDESKPYGGRWDASSPIHKRSQSPRSRPRPLADQTDRKYQRPIFLPDNDSDKEEGELSSSPARPTPEPDPNPNPASTLAQIYIIDLRALFSILLNAPEPREYILYPPCARRLGFPVDGWCAGNQAVQMHKVLESLVGGEPIHRREAQLKAQPGLPAPTPPPSTDVPALLEGIAGGPKPDAIQASHQSFADSWNNADDEDEDDW